jgi:radical SAM protein with 4Fe4S-binding SPASM domain
MQGLKQLYSRFRRQVFFLKNKGIKYTYNHLYFFVFWGWIRKHPSLIKLLNWLSPYPSYIEIEVTTKCNLRCIICEHTFWDEPNRDMSFEEFKSIIEQFPKLKWIGLTGIGESFMHKDFLKMLQYVKSKNIIVELYDTFYFIDEKTSRELIKLEIDNFFVSLDAATKETYEKIRVGSDFDRVVNNVKNFIRIKKEMNAFFPELKFHYIVNKLNFHEIVKYVELVKHLCGCDNTSIQFTRMLHYFTETKDLYVEVPPQIISDVEKKSKELGIPISWNQDVQQNKPPLNHCIEWTMPFIFVTGHVIPCCSGNEAGQREFQKETAMGNIFEKTFEEIWYGEKYKSTRKMLRQGKATKPCKNCCLYNVGTAKSCAS